jgi:hypothetical protein
LEIEAGGRHHERRPSADVMTLARAALTGPDRTTAISTTAKAHAASVPTAYSAVVMPAEAVERTAAHRERTIVARLLSRDFRGSSFLVMPPAGGGACLGRECV